jgi:uncharacterized membrane protein
VMMVPRQTVVELPLTVEEAMRLLVSGGVISPGMRLPGKGQAAAAEGGAAGEPGELPGGGGGLPSGKAGPG